MIFDITFQPEELECQSSPLRACTIA